MSFNKTPFLFTGTRLPASKWNDLMGAIEAAVASGSISPGASVPDATNSTNVVTRFNALLSSLRSIGLLQQPPISGTFFDSADGSSFADMSYPTDAALTVTSGTVSFSSSTQKALDLKVKRADGTILKWALDTYEVDASGTWTSFPAIDAQGVYVGGFNDELDAYAVEIKAASAAPTQWFARLVNNGSPLVNDSLQQPFAPGDSWRLRYIVQGNQITGRINYQSSSNRDLNLTQTFTASSLELPRRFTAPFVRFMRGVGTMTALKVTASYAGAKFAFVGDSLTQGRFATNYSEAFAQKIRADYPNNVLVAGAPGATTSDWTGQIQDVVKMRPKYAFVMLGTNDITAARGMSFIQADYTAILNALVAGGIIPIILTTPPRPGGGTDTQTLNAWLKGLGYGYVDTYAALVGTGTAMNPSYDSGDGIHMNTAGNAVVYSAVKAYITANGL